jgi:CRP/FNR family cyclic AMP-dependent transcriptional regulator
MAKSASKKVNGKVKELPIFHGLPERAAVGLWPLLHEQKLKDDAQLFEQGDPAEQIYVVVDGEIQIIYCPEDGGSIMVGAIRRGGVVGLSAALGRRVYTSGARSSGASYVVWIAREDLKRFCRSDSGAGELVLERLAHAIAGRLEKPPNDIALKLHQALMRGCDVKEGSKEPKDAV